MPGGLAKPPGIDTRPTIEVDASTLCQVAVDEAVAPAGRGSTLVRDALQTAPSRLCQCTRSPYASGKGLLSARWCAPTWCSKMRLLRQLGIPSTSLEHSPQRVQRTCFPEGIGIFLAGDGHLHRKPDGHDPPDDHYHTQPLSDRWRQGRTCIDLLWRTVCMRWTPEYTGRGSLGLQMVR